MKNKQPKPNILLDTSFLLPTLGIDTGKEVLKTLKKLTEIKADIHYSSFSILESLGIAAHLSQKGQLDTERFKQGLTSIMKATTYKKIPENSSTFNEALKLHLLGHKDMIDNILYTSSIHLNLKLLTLDAELKKFIKNKRLTDTLISPAQV